MGSRGTPCWSGSGDPGTGAPGQGSPPFALCLPSRHVYCRDLGTAARKQQTLGPRNYTACFGTGNTSPPAGQLSIRATPCGVRRPGRDSGQAHQARSLFPSVPYPCSCLQPEALSATTERFYNYFLQTSIYFTTNSLPNNANLLTKIY